MATCTVAYSSARLRMGMKKRGTYCSMATKTPQAISSRSTWPTPYHSTSAIRAAPHNSMKGK